ncbi:TRAP transporter substrate-binding protein [Mariluticola halotolerans]|uniref:TRAP transporter substrate-binding protein n=1 Tax=Mariluticola halotolerans TaxID=2909283 RepID=UPI0026E4161B|nr:TRAP transporter substrate-binding protein [Mariluticola halotolerans]UJQ94658.1 TRAP transporter substrate-binding protein [Mariluticola halotolerans]
MKNFVKSAILGLAVGALTLPMAASAQTVLRLAENQPDSNPVTVAMYRFADLVKEYSNGDVVVQVFAGAQLGQEPETIEQAQAGIVDFARVNSVVLANVSPSMGVFTLPYIFRNNEHKYAVLDGEIGQQVSADLAKVGLVGFDYMDAGSRSFYTVEGKPITSIEDMAGLKIRVQPAPISTRMVELLGAVPTPMNYGEVYSSLQTGVIDGAENDYVSYQTSGHFEVAPNYVEDAHLSPPAVLIMNKAKFDGLPADQQDAIKRAAKDAAIYEREIMMAANVEAKKTVEAGGATVTVIDNAPFQAAVAPIYEEFPDLLDLIEQIKAVK